MMRNINVIVARELRSYFSTPLAYIFIVIFLVLTSALTFYIGNFFERGQASLDSFFLFHPWLYLFLIPSLSMRLWAEENKSGSLELLMTLPISTTQAVMGKFLAAWIFSGVALLLTFPIWLTVNLLGSPDNGAILAGYIGSFLMAGAYLAVGSCISAATKNQVIAFVIAMAVCFLYCMSGLPLVLEFVRTLMPEFIATMVSSLSFMTHFDAMSKGVFSLKDIAFFFSTMTVWLYATVMVIDLKRG